MRIFLFYFFPLLFTYFCLLAFETSASSEKMTFSKSINSPSTIYIEAWDDQVKSKTLYLVPSINVASIDYFSEAVDSTKADTAGYFSFQTPIEEGFYQIWTKEERNVYWGIDFYLFPNDSLIIQPSKEGDKYKYSGSAGIRNNYQWQERFTFFEDSVVRAVFMERYFLPLDSFTFYMQNRRNEMHQFLDKYHQKQKFNETFYAYLQSKIDYHWLSEITEYQRLYHFYQTYQFKYISYDSLGIDYLNDPALQNKCCPFSKDYQRAIQGLHKEYFEQTYGHLSDSLQWVNRLNKDFEIAKTHFTGTDRDIALLVAGTNANRGCIDKNEQLYTTFQEMRSYFKANKTSETHYKAFEQLYERLEAFSAGKPAPNFTLPNSEGKQVSLSDFKGKVVYIDFWGTWCYACVKALPDLTELQKEFEGKEVVFLMVAMEEGENAIDNWKSFITKKKVPGVHVIAEDGQKTEQILPYYIRSAPTYMLIDQEGKVVNSRAAGPGEVKEAIRELL